MHRVRSHTPLIRIHRCSCAYLYAIVLIVIIILIINISIKKHISRLKTNFILDPNEWCVGSPQNILLKKFSLVFQKENFEITKLVEELDDMFLAYYIMKRQFERNPEATFSLPYLHKVISGVKVEQNENGTLYKYQDITLQYYERNMILEALTERFGALSEENDHGEDKSGTAIAGHSILHDVCRVLDS